MFENLTQQAGRLAKGRRAATMKKQRGAIAIEFAVLFVVFFVTLYAIIAYSIPLLLTLTFKQLSSDAGRAAIKVDPGLADAEYTEVISNEVTRVIDASWLPSDWVSGCSTAQGAGTWSKLPVGTGSTSYGFLAKEILDEKSNNYRYVLQVCLERKKTIIPTLNIMGIQVPKLPEENGEVVMRSYTTVRL